MSSQSWVTLFFTVVGAFWSLVFSRCLSRWATLDFAADTPCGEVGTSIFIFSSGPAWFQKRPPVFYNELCKLKPTFSQLTLQPCLCLTCVLQFICDSPFDSSVNSTHRLVRLPSFGSVALSSRATVTWLVRVDVQKLKVFWCPCVWTIELSWASTVQCV